MLICFTTISYGQKRLVGNYSQFGSFEGPIADYLLLRSDSKFFYIYNIRFKGKLVVIGEYEKRGKKVFLNRSIVLIDTAFCSKPIIYTDSIDFPHSFIYKNNRDWTKIDINNKLIKRPSSNRLSEWTWIGEYYRKFSCKLFLKREIQLIIYDYDRLKISDGIISNNTIYIDDSDKILELLK
jgi:hypothetical protein